MSIDVGKYRQPDHPIASMILHRWSPRAMSGEAVSESTLRQLFEAARWAPSCFNEQPWRLQYAYRETDSWPTFFALLAEANQSWVANAAVLVVVLSRRAFLRSGKPNRTHSLDTGAAWQNLALQGSSLGLVVHGMAGFDYERARTALQVPDDYSVEMMIAIGRPGREDALPQAYRDKERPSGRKAVAEFAFEGLFSRS